MTKMQFINAYLKAATAAQVSEFARIAERTDIYRDVECVTLETWNDEPLWLRPDDVLEPFTGWAGDEVQS
jgi:hypothetical protein